MGGEDRSLAVISDLADDIGVEASYFRREEDRLYLTGIEIVLLVATGGFSNFLTGILNGAKKSARKVWRTYEQAMDELVKRADLLRSKIQSIESAKTQQL